MEAARSSVRHGTTIVAVCLTLGCGKLAGLGDYEVASGCPAGSLRDDTGRCVVLPKCEGNAIPLVNGECAQVPALDCGDHFERDESTAGGCQPVVPECAQDWLGALGTSTCEAGITCWRSPLDASQGLFVKSDAAPGGTGERGSEFRTIQEALENAAGRPEPVVTIHIFPGAYRGSVRLERPISLAARCPQETTLTGDPGRPVLEIGPNADGSSVGGLTLTGEGTTAGVRVDGAEDVSIGRNDTLIVGPVAGPGITFEDTSGPTFGRIIYTVVYRAVGKGIAVYGVSNPRAPSEPGLVLDNVRIVNTQPDSVDGSAIGIVVAPSISITSERVAVSGIWNVAAAQRSYATVVDSRIDGARGSGFLVEGSDIDIDRTSIRRVIADERGRSAGIRVRRWWLGDLAASLNLARSTIAEVEGAGVHLDDVDSAKLRDVTIRDVATPAEAEANPGMFGGCAGNGVRARSRMPRGIGLETIAAPVVPVQLERVVIERTRESAVHVEGVAAALRDSVIRDVQGCPGGLGDGIAVHGYDFAPASVAIETTRISGVARAAVSLFGARGSIVKSSFESCDPVVRAQNLGASGVEGADDSVCFCSGSLRPCSSRELELEPALLGFPECDERVSRCTSVCNSDIVSAAAGNPRFLPGEAVWDPDHDGLASQHGDDERGCFTALSVPGHEHRTLLALSGQMPTLGLNPSRGAGRIEGALLGQVSNGTFGAQVNLVQGREQPDARNAVYIAFQVATPPDKPFTKETELVFSRGVVGVRGVLLDEHGAAIGDAWGKEAYYFGDGGAGPDPGRTVAGSNGTGYFYNVPAGRYLLRFEPPEGAASMSCSVDPVGIGWPAEQPNTFRVYAEAGVNTTAVRAFCEVH